MTNYEKCRALRQCILNRAAEVMNYTNWSNDFAAKQIKETHNSLSEQIGEIDIGDLTSAQMDDLGFGRWSDENQMRLIPLWLFQFLPEIIESKCINGKSMLKKSDMDTDNRFGFLAYGIMPKDALDTARPVVGIG